jgi:hypothetical protein
MQGNVDVNALEKAGWQFDGADWYFYSTESRGTHLQARIREGGGLPVEFIAVKVNDYLIGRLFNGNTGLTDFSLIEGNKVKATTALEFRKALTPFP